MYIDLTIEDLEATTHFQHLFFRVSRQVFNWILRQTNYNILVRINRILQADFLAQFPSFPFILRRSSSEPASTPPQSYPSSENDSESVYTESEGSDCEVGEDDCKEDPDFTFTGSINLSFEPPVTRSSPRSPLRLIPSTDTVLDIPVSYTTFAEAPTTPVVGPSTPAIKRHLSAEFSLPPPKRVNHLTL